MKKVFLGIGMGPIQTGIFFAGAWRGKFDSIIVAEVDEKLKAAVNAAGKVAINIADENGIHTEEYGPVTAYSPMIPEEREKLIEAAADASELATALPSVKFFGATAEWLREGFRRQPGRRRFVYTAENDNHAAEKLAEAMGESFPETYYLNTVVGKMSGVLPGAECDERSLAKLAPSADRGHLVEAFNKIYISAAPGIETRAVENLYVKNDLYPFEEAKLYGHNAVHFLLGMLGKEAKLSVMSDLRDRPDLVELGRKAFIEESGKALCAKYKGVDELFTEAGFKAYAEDLLVRMTNKYLTDRIDRVTRDVERKLSWNDRSVGTMRLVLSQGAVPATFAKGAKLAALELFGPDAQLEKELYQLWDHADAEARSVAMMILNA